MSPRRVQTVRPLDTSAALLEKGMTVFGRISRLAPFATPGMRLHVMGELALTENVLDKYEATVVAEAQRTLARLHKPKRLKAAGGS